MHHCICRATLQFCNDDPKEWTNYVRSCLILPHGVQYNDRLFLTILEPWNHHSPLIDPTIGEPYPMEWLAILRPRIQSLKGIMRTLSCIPPFKMPTMDVGTLHHEDTMRDGYQPKMLLFTLDELFYIYSQIKKQRRANNKIVIAYKILCFSMNWCTDWW